MVYKNKNTDTVINTEVELGGNWMPEKEPEKAPEKEPEDTRKGGKEK